MGHPHHHTHRWSDMMSRFAQELGDTGDHTGVLCFTSVDGPFIVAELLDDGRALGLTVDLQHSPDASQLESFLAANRVQNAQDAGLYALAPGNRTLLFFRRLEDANAYTYEEWVNELHAFEETAKAALQALPHALDVGAPSQQGDWAENAESFRHIWADFAFTQRLGDEPALCCDDGSFILALEGHGYVFVRPDNARGRVALKMVIALLPLLVAEESAVWSSLLCAHALGEGSGGAVFAIDHEAQELVVWRSLPMAGLNGYRLNDAIDHLAQVAHDITEELKLNPFAAVSA